MITGVILARNEEGNIIPCLESLRPHVSEIILIDMESSDRTVELARPYVDKILSHPLVPQFDAARNMAIPEARNEWLWFVDADERIRPETGSVVNQLLREHGHEFEVLNIPFQSYFCGQWMRYCGWWPGYTSPRVLKKGFAEFSPTLHGGVVHNGREVRLPPEPSLAIQHHSYRDLEQYLMKLNRYTSTEALQLRDRGFRWNWRTALSGMVHDLWEHYELKDARRDGDRGWILTWLSSQYRWLSVAKLIDLQEGPSDPEEIITTSVPESLDEFMQAMEDELAFYRKSTPRCPLGIVWRGRFWEPSGYGEQARAAVKALAAGDRPITIESLGNESAVSMSETDAGLIRALERTGRPYSFVSVTHDIPTRCQPDPCAVVNVLHTSFETDSLPEAWHNALGGYDEIWVTSEACRDAFRRSGFAPEFIRVLRDCVDTNYYRPTGRRWKRPQALDKRFVFLSVFDWQLRKGWDVLLKAYCSEFRPEEGTGLLLKTSNWHGYTKDQILDQMAALLAGIGQSLGERTDLVLVDQHLRPSDMPALYRSAGAFVLPSRGEACGRIYLEAMACGLPVIATRGSAMAEYLEKESAYLVDAAEVEVPKEACREIPLYQGQFRPQRWWEPDEADLRRQMRRAFHDKADRRERAQRALAAVRKKYSLTCGRESITHAVAHIESRFLVRELADPQPGDIRVIIEGEVCAGHSFSNINEELILGLAKQQGLALAVDRIMGSPTFDDRTPALPDLKPFLGRRFSNGPEVTIRHAYPPNFDLPASGQWIHMQPWELWHLPIDWLTPLRDRVDEVWAYSSYVRDTYIRSGVAADKVHVISCGVDPGVFHPGVPARILPTKKSFRFLYVGGLIARKGFDRVLDAYRSEFTRRDDVCLVVKGMGSSTFYWNSTLRDALLGVLRDATAPEIVYIDQEMTAGQLASLYAACSCLVAPYRGEGFGLPILEAMACGLAPIVPKGGASDDYANERNAFLLPSQLVPSPLDWTLCGPAMELAIDQMDLRQAMRHAYENADSTRALGQQAAASIQDLIWERTVQQMGERIRQLVRNRPAAQHATAMRGNTAVVGSETESHTGRPELSLAVLLVTQDDESALPDCLARLRPLVDRIVVFDEDSSDRSRTVAGEYGAEVRTAPRGVAFDAIAAEAAANYSCDWFLCADPNDRIASEDIEESKRKLAESPPDATSAQVPAPRSRLASANGKSRDALLFFRSTQRAQANAHTGAGSTDALAHPFFEVFDRDFAPHLGARAATFRQLFARLLQMDASNRDGFLILETGCVRQLDDWTAGQSTILFDRCVNHCGGRVISIDISPQNCEHARGRVSERTTVVNDDSVRFLSRFAAQNPGSLHCLYLDSLDVDWANPHASALHHLEEVSAGLAALRRNGLVVIDDHRDDNGRPGKSLYAAEYLRKIGAKKVFEDVQIGWIVKSD